MTWKTHLSLSSFKNNLLKQHLRRVWTCYEYLTSILAPVGTSRADHVLSDHISVVVVTATRFIGQNVHLSLAQELGPVPQTWGKHEEWGALFYGHSTIRLCNALIMLWLTGVRPAHLINWAFGLHLSNPQPWIWANSRHIQYVSVCRLWTL